MSNTIMKDKTSDIIFNIIIIHPKNKTVFNNLKSDWFEKTIFESIFVIERVVLASKFNDNDISEIWFSIFIMLFLNPAIGMYIIMLKIVESKKRIL